MLKKRTIFVSFLMLMICFSTFLYFDGILGKIDPIIKPDIDDINTDEIISEIKIEEVKINPPDDPTTNISGDYKTVAYFTQDSFVDLDANGYVFEWEKYEDVIYEMRKRVNDRRHRGEWEYLYNAIMKYLEEHPELKP